MFKIHTDTIDNRMYQIGYKVVTENMQSLGLRKNPHILTFPFNEEYRLDESKVEEGKGDWGGIWVARIFSGAVKLRQYMKTKHNKKTRIFKAALDQILYINNYRIKTNAVKLYEELFPF